MIRSLKKRLMHMHTELVLVQSKPVLGVAARFALWGFMGIDIPARVTIGRGFKLAHGGYGVVVYHGTIIGENVLVFQGVTIGLQDLAPDPGARIEIQDDVVLCAGAKILAPPTGLVVGRGTVVGANAVLTQSTGEREVWAGVPAKKVGLRDEPPKRPRAAREHA